MTSVARQVPLSYRTKTYAAANSHWNNGLSSSAQFLRIVNDVDDLKNYPPTSPFQSCNASAAKKIYRTSTRRSTRDTGDGRMTNRFSSNPPDNETACWRNQRLMLGSQQLTPGYQQQLTAETLIRNLINLGVKRTIDDTWLHKGIINAACAKFTTAGTQQQTIAEC